MATYNANELINRDDNAKTLLDFFTRMADGSAYDGTSHQLYLDLNDGEIIYNHEISGNSWLQRNDGSLEQILTVSGYSDVPEDELYAEGCDLLDYGYAEWLDYVEQKTEEALSINNGGI